MQTQELFPKPQAITLTIQGKIPSFKNNKMVLTHVKTKRGRRPLPRPMLITKPEFQEAMKSITDSFVSQLLSAFQTSVARISVESSIRSLIASSLPADDSWAWIPKIEIKAELCEPGREGATLVVERL